MRKKFYKSDLRLCDLVELRNGSKYLIIRGSFPEGGGSNKYENVLLNIITGKHIKLKRYDDYLKNKKDKSFDILKLKHWEYSGDVFRKISRLYEDENLTVDWDWIREDVKEVTMLDVEQKFGCKVKIGKE